MTGALDSVVVVTSDSHVDAPPEAYRPYCPKKYLEEFDGYVEESAVRREAMRGFLSRNASSDFTDDRLRNLGTDGHLDVHARIRDMDRDGVAAEVIFHGSPPHNGIPFNKTDLEGSLRPEEYEMTAVGRQIYNSWLGDFCSVEPERHVGLAQLPMWDIDAALAELERAHELGLRGVNFPAPRREIPPYESPDWEPFWAACEQRGMVLANHGGAGATAAPVTGPSGVHILTAETVPLSRVTPMCRLVFGGVFERHPNLFLAQTEQPGWWYTQVLDDLDSQYMSFQEHFSVDLPRLPSDYCRTNYFIGASFQAHFEAEAAVREGVSGNMMWGSDYPHPEGTYRYTDHADDTPITHLALRSTFAGIPAEPTRAMIGENAMRVYGFDAAKLQAVAERINAPTLDGLAQPIDERPEHWTLAFRKASAFA
jgi:predicted TIM-barrel fold metal-dependent hydrolase